jgi:hypothetical protein
MENKDQEGKSIISSSAPIIANVQISESSDYGVNGRTNINANDEISFKEIVLKLREWYRYLGSKWLVILIAGLAGGIMGLAYAWLKKPVYTATTTFVLESGDGGGGGGLGQYAGIASMVGIDLGGGGGGIFQGDNILELYKSRAMIQKTLLSPLEHDGKKQLLIERFIESNDLRGKWKRKPELANIQFSQPGTHSRLQDSIMGEIVKDINKTYLTVGKPDKKLSIIKVEVKSKDEVFAKVFNEQIVKNVNDFYVQTKTKKSLDNVAILQQKTDSVRTVMTGAIYTAASVSDATPNLNPTRQVQRVAPIQRSQFTAETNKAILSELVKNLEMSKIALRKETPLIQVVDQPIFPLEKESSSKAKGLIFGGVIFGFLAALVLIVRYIFRNLLRENQAG